MLGSEYKCCESERDKSSHLNSEPPHGTDRYSRDGSKVVGGYNGTLFGPAHTCHPLQQAKQVSVWVSE